MTDRPIEGNVTFVQHFLPALDAGRYTLDVSHIVRSSDPDPKKAFTETNEASVDFVIAGNRWTLDPAEIDSMFPPPDVQGEFANVLPHVVLTRRTLPWERSPEVLEPTDRKVGNAEADVPSWLALLLFDEADPPPSVQASTLAALQGGGETVVCYPKAGRLEWGERATDPCRLIDVPRALFDRIAPSLNDLKWLAHGRQVDLARKAGPAAGTTQSQDFAVILGSRLPRKGHRSTVHLVSLEGLAGYLPGDDGAPSSPSGAVVRLVSVASWGFDALPEDETFSQVLERVKAGPLQFLKPDGATIDPRIQEAVDMGYVGLQHDLRDGARTASWLRGPFTPYPVTRQVTTPIDSADAVLRYDPRSGLFDASDAVAWQLGRLLALQNKEFSAQLYRWKHATAKSAIDAFEREQLSNAIAPMSAGPAAQTAAPTLQALALQLLKQAVPAFATTAIKPVKATRGMQAHRAAGPAKSLHALMSDVARVAALDEAGPAVPDVIGRFVQDLRHLVGVPYQHLVPDERLVPPESLRFFHLDQGWIDCLVDGALSLGRATQGDGPREAVHPARRLLALASGQSITGFLLRSRAVKHWPGLEISAYKDADQTFPAPPLRLDRLAPDVMLALFDGEVAVCRLHEPPEGLHFGVDVPDEFDEVDPTTFEKALRTPHDGVPMSPAVTVPLPYRTPDSLVLKAATLAGDIVAALKVSEITAAEFGLEMVEGVAQVTFRRVG